MKKIIRAELAKSTAVDAEQKLPLFLKEKGGAGERENFFSREKKFFPSSQERIHFNRIAGRYCDDSHSGGDIAPCIEQCP